MENSSASGIYYCVASNKIGEEERSIEFYVSGKLHKNQMLMIWFTLKFYMAGECSSELLGIPACCVFRALPITQSQAPHHMEGWVLRQCPAEFGMSSIRPDAPFALFQLQMQALSLAACLLKQHSWHLSAVLMKPPAKAQFFVVFQRPEASPWLRRRVGLQLSQQT